MGVCRVFVGYLRACNALGVMTTVDVMGVMGDSAAVTIGGMSDYWYRAPCNGVGVKKGNNLIQRAN